MTPSIFGPPTIYQTPTVTDPDFPRNEGSLGVAEHIEPEIKQCGIVEESTVNKIFKQQGRIISEKDWAEAMVGHLTRRKMKLGSIVARFEGDVSIKDVDDNSITITFSKDISPENKAEIQRLIIKLFEEINESPVIIKQDGLT